MQGTTGSVKGNMGNILSPHGGGFDIQDTLVWYIHAFQERTGIHCKARCRLHDRIAENTQSVLLFQIFEEILIDIARHAEATKVWINLGDHAGILILSVMDNGRGIKAECAYSEGFRGIDGVREYVRLCGGECRVSHIPGQGTTVVVSIPIQRGKTRHHDV